MPTKWNGKAIIRKVERACRIGIDQTMAEAVEHAKRSFIPGPPDAPVDPDRLTNRTSILEGSIRAHTPARIRLNEIIGIWGSVDNMYAVFHELGTSKMKARPFLRPAADAVYPRLAGNIRRAFSGKKSAATLKGLAKAKAFREKFGAIK